jgi:hypothetical protein
MGSSGCCNGTKCETCNEGQTGNCSGDDDCQTTKENFSNRKLTNTSGGYFTAEGDFIPSIKLIVQKKNMSYQIGYIKKIIILMVKELKMDQFIFMIKL